MKIETRFSIGDYVVFIDEDAKASKFKVRTVSCMAFSDTDIRTFYYDKDGQSHDWRRCFGSLDELMAHVKGGMK